MPQLLIVTLAVALGLLVYWRVEAVLHARRIKHVAHRIHVNGIRGKSTVTRIIAGMLREAGLATIGKSTGTFAAVIDTEGVDIPIKRKGAPTILEQIDIARDHITPDIDCWVIECMAVSPAYQKASEELIVQSNIGVLTNVREDHQDVMGETLPEIARSLLTTCPRDGVLITSEQSPEILEIIEEVAQSKNAELIVADPTWVTDDDIAAFDYIAFKENVAIGYALADLLGIDREIALKGMINAAPDPGVLRLQNLTIGEKQVTWANLFAVNDRESMIAAMDRLAPFQTHQTTMVGILNNRSDRERRATQFADVAVNDLRFDYLVTFGAFEKIVTDRLRGNGFPRARILNLGEDHHPSVDQIIDQMVHGMPTEHVMLVGFVNIHTHQAEMMLEYFDGLGRDQHVQEVVRSHA